MKQDSNARTYRLKPETVRRLSNQIDTLGCWPSDLVDLLLQRALTEVEEGRWTMDRQPAIFEIAWGEPN